MKINVKSFFSETLLRHNKKLRTPQLELSLEIEKAYNNKQKFIAEAEVGTGKTYAYIIPALNKINEDKKPLLISTGTIVLQEQLAYKDIPDINGYLIKEGFISKTLISLVGKGKEHYICEKRLSSYTGDDKTIELICNLYQSKNIFDRSQFKDFTIKDEQWNKINVCDCNRNNCKYYDCLYKKYKLNLDTYNCDIMVCNHQYLLSCLKDTQKEFIKNFSAIVIDEAHNLERAAFSILGDCKNLKDFTKCFDKLYNKFEIGTNKYKNKLTEAIELSEKLFKLIEMNTIIPPDDLHQNDFPYSIKINKHIKMVAQILQGLLIEFSERINVLNAFKHQTKFGEERLDFEVNRLISFLEKIYYDENKVFWVQLDHKLKPKLFYIPYEIDEILYERLFEKEIPVILTSATMSSVGSKDLLEKDFGYFMNSIGVDLVRPPYYKKPISKKSNFDYYNHGILYLEKDLEYVSREKDNYQEYLRLKSEKIYQIIKNSNGRSLVLFTAKDSMDYTYSTIANRLKMELGIDCYKQGQSASIKQKFEKNIQSCLFATGSYWEGIDVKGESLSCLIIDKLPFPTPGPLVDFKEQKLGEEIKIPEMIIKLKQGAGRLIRDERDKGALVILDSRAYSNKYLNLIKNSLPEFKIIEDINDINNFLYDKRKVS